MVEIVVKVFMVKSMSWARPESRAAADLRHEQVHFDITRIVAERFKETLRNTELTVEDYDSEIQYLFLEIYREVNKMQEAYDRDTDNGQDKTSQDEWNDKVAAQIESIYTVKL
jgi:predicted secreted Zn-dependent protease